MIESQVLSPAGPVIGDSAEHLLWLWGLRPGRSIKGWTVESTNLRQRDGAMAVVVSLRSGAGVIDVVFGRAGNAPRLARVGGIDLTHGSVDASLGPQARGLVNVLAAWLQMHGAGKDLLPFLVKVPASADATMAPAPSPPTPVRDRPSSSYVEVKEAPPLDPALRASEDHPFMEFQFVELSDIGRWSDALRSIYEGLLGGLVIRGVYSKDDVARVVERLEAGGQAFPITELPPSQKGRGFGKCVECADPALEEYLTAAASFRENAGTLFAGTAPFEPRMEEMFAQLSGGRPVSLAKFTDGRTYTPATIRILPEGAQLATHCGNEMFNRPGYVHLNSIADTTDQISYFLTLQEAEQGGALIVYSLKWSDIGPGDLLPDGRSNVGALLGRAEWMEIKPRAGDLLVFDGGRFFHRVDFVRGARTRWTIGGFLVFDRSGENVHYWA